MSARLMDRARAFAVIADHLTDERRAEIAEALAMEVATTATKKQSVGELAATDAERERPPVDPPGQISVATFLASKGLEGVALVRGVGALTPMLSREWIARYGVDDDQPVGYVPSTHRALLDRVWEGGQVTVMAAALAD
jgi:hypothetical protein